MQVCHVNMLKEYHSRPESQLTVEQTKTPSVSVGTVAQVGDEVDGLYGSKSVSVGV